LVPAVERRRRETINEGINELAKIVPGCEKNKGSILQRAVAFITQLKENEAQNIEKWTLEKLLTEQAIAELSGSVDKLKNECERAWREAETWKKTCQSAGLDTGESNGDTAASTSGNADGPANGIAET
jgi:bHLH factor